MYFEWFVPQTRYVCTAPSVQFSSVAQSYLTLCSPMDCSMPGLPVHHLLPELTQTHVHRVGDAIQLLQEGRPLPGPETGLLSDTQKWIVRGDTCADKARDFIGNRHPGGEQEGKGTQENCSAEWLAVSDFMVMGLVSGWPLANHSNSESFLVVHASLSQDGC